MGSSAIDVLARTTRFFHDLLNPVLYAKDAQHCAHALVFAVENGRMRTAQLSLLHGAAARPAILAMALKTRNLHIVRLLLEAGADPNGHHLECESHLAWCLKPQDANLFQNPRFHGGRLQRVATDHADRRREEYRRTSSKIPLLTLILDYDYESGLEIKVNGPLWGGATLLHYAAYFDYPDVAARLIQMGADIDAVDSLGRTPLCDAVVNYSISTARVLMNHGAFIDHRMGFANSTPLQYTISYGILGNTMAAILIDGGADLVTPNGLGNTLLHEAALSGDYRTAHRLLERHVPIEPLNNRYETPIQVAVGKKNITIVQLLLQFDTDPACQDVFRNLDPRDYDQPQALPFLAQKQLNGQVIAAIARAISNGIRV